MAIFEPLAAPNCWQPSALAAGPFAGLQGGAVASLLTAEVEALAEERKWGTAVSATAWFLRPTPMASLRTQLAVLTEGGRVSVIDNTLWPDGEEEPCATVRVTLSRERAVGLPGSVDTLGDALDPTRFPVRTPQAGHGRQWFMDAMEVDPWHCAPIPECRCGSQSQPDGPTVQAAARRVGWHSRANPLATCHRGWNRKRYIARRAR